MQKLAHQPVCVCVSTHTHHATQAAEAVAAQEESRITAATLRAEDAERKLAELGHKRQRHLADITNLK